ncbi:DMT family transporter [Aureimonas fodinaquatilis]|uniref:DMT family transporter n=2 Tax=Aureimonas fodinaquatilis TaxID=2565783 RepID=A0A5B0DQK1_9HYPH|nr:DMT family transporter [Aureimonas fodinaquatilis]
MPAKSDILSGILLTIIVGMCFASMDALAKAMTASISVLFVVWGRNFFHTLLVTATLAYREKGFGFVRTRHPMLHSVRSLCLLTTGLLMYYSLKYIPLADATAVLFFAPVFVTALSVVFLKEKIGWHRIFAVIAGFIGVLLVVRPGLAGTNPYLLLPLAGVGFHSIYLLMTRRLVVEEKAATTQFYSTIAGVIVMTAVVIPIWQTPSTENWTLLFLIGAIGAAGHSFLVKAFSYAPASLLTPFLYSQVIFASAISVIWFGDDMHPLTIVGTCILVLSGLYIWWRENRRKI